MPKLSVDALEMTGRRVFVRVDFNVPLDEKGAITDDRRIHAAVPTIRRVIESGGRAVLASHLGRPKGPDPKQSLRPCAARLSEILGKPVKFLPSCIGFETHADVSAMKDGEVVLLENLRFQPGEEASAPELVASLARNADLYVNDAFGTCHRDAASMTGLPRALGRGAAGYLVQKELAEFAKVLRSPARPFVAVLGGAKVSDKLPMIRHILDQVDVIIVGGAMAYTFLRAKGIPSGASRCELTAETKDKKTGATTKIDLVAEARAVCADAEAAKKTIMLPLDHVVAAKLEDGPGEQSHGRSHVVEGTIPDGLMGLDIGPRTIRAYELVIARAKTVVWNGPMGVFEKKGFEDGTFAIARALARATTEDGAITVVGGGDSALAAEMAGVAEQLTHVSTGGGASLELLEGKTLPGVAALTDV